MPDATLMLVFYLKDSLRRIKQVTAGVVQPASELWTEVAGSLPHPPMCNRLVVALNLVTHFLVSAWDPAPYEGRYMNLRGSGK